MELAQDPRLFSLMSHLWKETYASKNEMSETFQHPYGPFNPLEGYMYINRVCYRVPDVISSAHRIKKKTLQRSLTPHWDLCPSRLFSSTKEIPRWRPIQCFVALTANHKPSTGGFEAIRGFHREFEQYHNKKDMEVIESKEQTPTVCVGDFAPARESSLLHRMEHIPYEAGSVIFWDWRIPHANAYHHVGHLPREVVYTGFLPAISMNKTFAAAQLERYWNRKMPVDHWQNVSEDETHPTLLYDPCTFSNLGQKLMGITPWKEASDVQKPVI